MTLGLILSNMDAMIIMLWITELQIYIGTLHYFKGKERNSFFKGKREIAFWWFQKAQIRIVHQQEIFLWIF